MDFQGAGGDWAAGNGEGDWLARSMVVCRPRLAAQTGCYFVENPASPVTLLDRMQRDSQSLWRGGGMENGIKEESQTMDACRRADAEEKSPKKTTPPLISKPLGFALPCSPCMGACGNGAGLFLHRMGRLEATANIYFCHPPKTIAATHLDAAGSE